MTRVLPLVLVTGCFYVQPINQRPSADIVQVTSGKIFRGETLVLQADTNDPEGQNVSVAWRVYACSNATQPGGCDDSPFFTSILTTAPIPVPDTRADGTPAAALRVILEAKDARGAVAKPDQELVLPIEDQPPVVMLSKTSRYSYVVGTPVTVFANITDADDHDMVSSVDWTLFTPPSSTATLVDAPGIANAKVLTPDLVGDYDVTVDVTDPEGSPGSDHITITAAQDHPPCLAEWSPLADGTYPMQDPTLFEILVVADDLDPYPAVPGDPVMGQTSFSWSLLPPGATQRQALGAVGNSVALDPASYTPGDVLELRVEVADRRDTMVNCPDSDATCSVISDPSCIQRLTWRVEVQ